MVAIIGRKIPTTGVTGAQAGGLGNVFTGLANVLADPLTPEIKRQNLLGLEQGVRGRSIMADAIAAAQAAHGQVDPYDLSRGGVLSGKTYPDVPLTVGANVFGATSPEATNAAIGAGHPYSGTAAGQQAQLTAMQPLEHVIDPNTGRPISVTRQAATANRMEPVLTQPQVRGAIMQNYAFTPEQMAALPESVRQMIGPGGITIDQRQEGSFGSTVGKGQGENFNETLKTGTKAQDTLTRLGRIENLLAGVETGSFAGAKASIGKIAKSFGLDDQTVASLGIDPNLPVTADTLKALVNPMIGQMIGTGPGAVIPANTFSEQDRKALEAVLPNITNLPGANKLAISMLRKMALRQQERANALRATVATASAQGHKFDSGDMLAFDKMFSEKINSEPDLFTNELAQIRQLPPSVQTPQAPMQTPAGPTQTPTNRIKIDANGNILGGL